MCYILYCLVLGALALTNTFTESALPIHVRDLNCSGNEESIWDCPNNGLAGYLCSHYDDAAVKCLRTFNFLALLHLTIVTKPQYIVLCL